MPNWRGGASRSGRIGGGTRSSTLARPEGQQRQQQQQQRRRRYPNPSYLSSVGSVGACAGGDGDGSGSRITRALRPAHRRRLLGTALFLCATGVILAMSLGRPVEDSRRHRLSPSAPLSVGVGDDADTSGPPPLGYERRTPYQSGGIDSGVPWIPPAERPIPLDKFPRLNGVGFQANGSLLDVRGWAPPAARTAASVSPRLSLNASSSSSEGGGGSGREGGGAGNTSAASAASVVAREGGPTTTLLFMHLWKCAGSSLRHLLRDWAEAKGQDIGIVVRCIEAVNDEGKICMQQHALIDEEVQGPFIRRQRVVAGHFTWGFQEHVHQPFVMFTTLRNPLELFVSGQQYLNRKAARHFAHAVSLVQETMAEATENHYLRGGVMMPQGKGNAKSVGFIYRLVDPVPSTSSGGGENDPKPLEMAAQEAKDHLDTFWLVGVIEQYKGFLAVLQAMMDPLESEPSLWESYAVGRYNKSPQGAGKVLAAIDPRLVQDFNNTLRQQWDVYGHAINLYKHRCRQMLRTGNLLDLCEVPEAPSEYTLTDLERESLYQELHPDTASLNVSEIVRAQQLWGDRGLDNKDLGVDEAFEFFEEQGFDLTDQHKVENLWLRLGIGESPFAEDAAVGDGVSDDGGDGGVGEDVDGGAGRADVGEEADGEAGGPISEEILGRPEWPNR